MVSLQMVRPREFLLANRARDALPRDFPIGWHTAKNLDHSTKYMPAPFREFRIWIQERNVILHRG